MIMETTKDQNRLLKPTRPVGIIGYGAYVPRYRLPATEISRIWHGGLELEPVSEKSVAGIDEDVVTMSVEASRNALARAGVEPGEIRAVWVGSESHPYAVKPTSTIVAEALGITPYTQAADFEFACKAGSEAIVAAMAMVGSGMGQLRPGGWHGYSPGKTRGCPGIHRCCGRCGLLDRSRGGIPGRDRRCTFLCDRYARFLAPRKPEIP